MKPIADLKGQIFGEFTVIEKAPTVTRKTQWVCRCSCGKEKIVYATHLLRGNTKSCNPGGMHGLGKATPGYTSWNSMLTRCYNPNHVAYHRYGGRGIQVCQRWRDSFLNFYHDMGEKPDGKTLERIDCNADYSPENCKWATKKEQSNNTCTNRFVLYQGVYGTIAQVADKLGINYNTLYSRITTRAKNEKVQSL